MTKEQERLEYLRGELRAERISQEELLELESLVEHIDPGDVELLEAAGVPEHVAQLSYDKKRKFYRSVIQIEVLSEEPLPDPMSLADIQYEITEGHCSGQLTRVVDNEVKTGPEMAQLLLNQASGPEFFMLDKDGNDISEE